MERKSQSRRIAVFAGSGMALGAAMGLLLFGLMGSPAGAIIGAVIGLVYEVQSRREQMD
jgi:uncharacterized membrane protein